MASLDEYGNRYRHVAFERHDGILEMRLHSNGGSLIWGAGPHRELQAAFADVGSDHENRVVIFTGTGDAFCAERDNSTSGARGSSEGWYNIYWEGKRLIENLLNIEVPVIAAINGPARYHAELAVLSDIVLASDCAVLQDKAHFIADIVPGDGVHIVWQLLLGCNRARYFLLTGEEIPALEAKTLGAIAEVLPLDDLMPRARALAARLAEQSIMTLRYSRVVLTQRLKSHILAELGHGLALEGLAILARP